MYLLDYGKFTRVYSSFSCVATVFDAELSLVTAIAVEIASVGVSAAITAAVAAATA